MIVVGSDMIVAKQKPLEEILKMVEPYENLLFVGCDGCVGVYQIGGERQSEELKDLVGMNRKLNKKKINAKALSIIRQCDRGLVESSLGTISEGYEAIVSLACGVGVQTLAEVFPKKMIVPANNTEFMGAHDRENHIFYELCKGCGECILYETGGICPVTRCAKSLLNGPCGGNARGKCEVGGWVKDCAWILIYERLKERGRLDIYKAFRMPKDFRLVQNPREILPATGEGKEGD
jgi:hypothetical protein